MNFLILGAAISVLSLASCTATNCNMEKGGLAAPKTFVVTVAPGASGDARIRAALEHELARRSLGKPGPTITVQYEDSWYWDIVMYLRGLSVKFTDTTNGNLIGIVTWRQKGFHVYPSQESAVTELLKTLETAGAFSPK